MRPDRATGAPALQLCRLAARARLDWNPMISSLPPLLPHATRDLARFAAATRYADIPAAVVDKVKLSILDGLGVCLHGATLPWTRKVRDVVLADGGNPIASVWGSGAKVGLTGAVLINSTAGHAF